MVTLNARKVPPLVTATPVSWVTAGYLIYLGQGAA